MTKKPAAPRPCSHMDAYLPSHARNCSEQKEPQSSPLPVEVTPGGGCTVWTSDGGRFADAVNREYAALIVRRVNQGAAFDALVKAVENTLESIDEYLVDGQSLGNTANKLRAALKLVQEAGK